MFSLELEADGDAKDILVAELWEQGSTGIVETELPAGRWLLRAFFEDEAGSDSLLRRFPGRIEQHPMRDWIALSQAGWEPICAGERFYLVPEWRDDPAPAGRFRIAINPGLACGTGYHEATQLCLEALEEYVGPQSTVVDVGTGSGILSIAATLLGARRVIGCDLDTAAVEIARSGAHVPLFIGSLDALRSGAADLIVANISAAVSIALAPEFHRCLEPGGRCVASGFEGFEAGAVESALEGAGLVIVQKMAKGEWRAMVAIRKENRRE